MAIYHFSCKTHNRAGESAKNAVRAAAYRAGATLIDTNTEKQYTYTSKEEVVFSEILAPSNAPEWVADRQRLWSEVEKSEKRIDATLFRDVDLALPNEFDEEQCKALMRDYITRVMTAEGIIVDYSIHWHEGNKHAHLMMTTREISGEGFGKKNRDWDSKRCLHTWRSEWSKCVNEHLKQEGFTDRVDHRSLKAQGLDREPTIHVGPERATTQKIVHERKRRNRRIRSTNKAKDDLKLAEIEVAEAQAAVKALKVTVVKAKLLKSLVPVDRPADIDEAEIIIQPVEVVESEHLPEPKANLINLNFVGEQLDPINMVARYNMQSVVPDALEEYEARCNALSAVGNKQPYTWTMFHNDFMQDREHADGYRYAWWGRFHQMHKQHFKLYTQFLSAGVARHLKIDFSPAPTFVLKAQHQRAINLMNTGLAYRKKQFDEAMRFFDRIRANRVSLVQKDVRYIKAMLQKYPRSAMDTERLWKSVWQNFRSDAYMEGIKQHLRETHGNWGLASALTIDMVKNLQQQGIRPKEVAEYLHNGNVELLDKHRLETKVVLKASETAGPSIPQGDKPNTPLKAVKPTTGKSTQPVSAVPKGTTTDDGTTIR